MKTDEEMREQCPFWGRNSINGVTFCTIKKGYRLHVSEGNCEDCDHRRSRDKFFKSMNKKRGRRF